MLHAPYTAEVFLFLFSLLTSRTRPPMAHRPRNARHAAQRVDKIKKGGKESIYYGLLLFMELYSKSSAKAYKATTRG